MKKIQFLLAAAGAAFAIAIGAALVVNLVQSIIYPEVQFAWWHLGTLAIVCKLSAAMGAKEAAIAVAGALRKWGQKAAKTFSCAFRAVRSLPALYKKFYLQEY